jgi:hypothetical protein
MRTVAFNLLIIEYEREKTFYIEIADDVDESDVENWMWRK